MTRQVRVLVACVLIAVVLAACSGSSSDPRSKRSSTTMSTTGSAARASEWVQQWDAVLVTDYGPAQEAFLAAVQTARVADVQEAILEVRTANEQLGSAITAAGNPPRSDSLAVTNLQRGLAYESSLIPLIQSACTGTDPKCQTLVTMYLDNNKDTIVPALTELRAAS